MAAGRVPASGDRGAGSGGGCQGGARMVRRDARSGGRPGAGPAPALAPITQLVKLLVGRNRPSGLSSSPSAFLNKKCLPPSGLAWHDHLQNRSKGPVTQREAERLAKGER